MDSIEAKTCDSRNSGRDFPFPNAAYAAFGNGKSLPDFLEKQVFASMESSTVQPDEKGSEGFAAFMENYKKGLSAEYAAAR